MADCLITSGIIASCDSLRRVGGVNKRFWVFNMNQLDKASGENGYTYTTDYVSAIAWTAYGGLYRFESQQKSHSGGSTVVSQPGGNRFFHHDVILKLLNRTPTDDQVIEELLVADVGVILETNNQEFKLYGGFNGMEVIEGSQNTGQESESDTAYTLTFQGEEKELPKTVLATDYATTIALLESYEL